MRTSRFKGATTIVRTAYGIRPINEVIVDDRIEIVGQVSDALSIRGRNPTEFYAKLKQLVKQYK